MELGVAKLDPITRKGKYLFQSDGTRFFFKGVGYQESLPTANETAESLAQGGFPEPDSFIDPLSLPDACHRDAPLIRELGANTIRVYNVNASLNHDECMKTFSDQGIYVIVDLGLPLNGSINRASPTWDVALLNNYMETAKAFWNYDNTIAYGIANEAVTFDNNTNVLPFVKAASRDLKAYMRANKVNVFLTFSSADSDTGLDSRRAVMARYLTCGEEEESIDLFGMNSYTWIGRGSYEGSGYGKLTEDFRDLSVPVYLSEFGGVPANDPDERGWTEVDALLSQPMTDVFSGGIAYTYFPKDGAAAGKDYSLTTLHDGSIQPRDNFRELQKRYADARPPTSGNDSPLQSEGLTDCPQQTSRFLASSTLPPTPDDKLCQCGLSKAFACQALPSARDNPPIVGELTDWSCGYLAQRNRDCSAIEANGTSGTYGTWSFCSPVHRLDWVMSQVYEASFRQSGACQFNYNATIMKQPASEDESKRGEEECISQNPVGVKIPVLTKDSDVNEGRPKHSGSSNGSSSDIQRCRILLASPYTIIILLLLPIASLAHVH